LNSETDCAGVLGRILPIKEIYSDVYHGTSISTSVSGKPFATLKHVALH